jgi:UDP-glucuronate decarboxylase
MIILVTGGSGFIGNHLCRELLQKGNYVICLDNNITGNMKNIEDLINNKNFEFIRHDITIPIYLEVDQIYHLACPASPKAYQKNGIKTIKTNVLGTMNVLGIAKRTGARILLTSTSEVYGDPTIPKQYEEYNGNVNPIGPRACYDEGKRIAETLMMEYYKEHKVDIRIARIFNTYGPNMSPDDGRVISNFIVQCIKNENITVYGDGSQTRSFCYVTDTVDGLIKLMNQTRTTGPINIGNPREITINETADLCIKKINPTNKYIIYNSLPVNDPMRRCPDISKAIDLVMWRPTIPLHEGINYTIDYFKKLILNN